MRRSTCFLLLLAMATLARGTGLPLGLPDALLTASADRVLARAEVPGAMRKVGEVRLVARADATVVQTLLATKVLGRVVSEIRKQEEGNWPAGQSGHEDMERYLAALLRAEAELNRHRDTRSGEDRRLRLVIEFVATTDVTAIFLGEFTGDEVDGRLEPTGRQAIETLVVSGAYALRNMRLILADAFKIPESDVTRLGPLGPAAVGAPQ